MVIFIGPEMPETLTRGRSQLLGNNEPSCGSRMHGPDPDGDEQVLVGAPGSTTGVFGKSVHRPFGPVHGVGGRPWPPCPRIPVPPLPPTPPSGFLTPAHPPALASATAISNDPAIPVQPKVGNFGSVDKLGSRGSDEVASEVEEEETEEEKEEETEEEKVDECLLGVCFTETSIYA
jgi:hypothetical protein